MPSKVVFPFFVLLLAIAGILPARGEAGAPDKPLAKLPSVLEELRRGGFVIFLRHTLTVQAGPRHVTEDLLRCETQRQLSPQGQSDAVRIGKAIRTLGIPIGQVTTSPYCRTKETAQLAFGRFTENPDLGFVIGSDADETRRMTLALRRMLASRPAKGSNDVIVSHSANLLEAAGIFAKPEGAAYVFQPLADGRFEAVAKILPDEWSEAGK